MKEIHLCNNNGFAWTKNGVVHAKGHVFAGKKRLLQRVDLCRHFEAETYDNFRQKVKETNGIFSVIVEKPGEIWMASDRTRTFPLFYSSGNDRIIVSDNIHHLANLIERPVFNKTSISEFQYTGFVSGCQTLLKDVCQVEAGQTVAFSDHDLKKSFYYHFSATPRLEWNYHDAKSQLGNLLDDIFKDTVESSRGKDVIIPLSGGFDSRLIACYFKKFKKKNVTCITYGKKNNPEAIVSEKVAKTLGFNWKFIEYTDELIEGFVDSLSFQEYYKYAAQLVSMFFMQEYFAVKYLKENNIFNDNAIFLPGFSADALAGSHLSQFWVKRTIFCKGMFIKQILNKHYNYNAGPFPGDFYNKIEDRISWTNVYDYNLSDEWDFTERQAKFINNSARVFEFFGYGFRFPFWDIRLMDFFGSLPFQHRYNKKLYDDTVKGIFKSHGVWFDEDYHVKSKNSRLKKGIKRLLPLSVKLQLLRNKDWQNYEKITSHLIENKRKEGKKIKFKGNSYNEIIMGWYLEEIKKHFNE